jgi:hypothetical protein
MNNYPNPLNLNPLNTMNNPAALSLLNNFKQFPQNIPNIDQANFPNMVQGFQNPDPNNLMKMAQPGGPIPNPIPNINISYPQIDPNYAALNQFNNFQNQIQNINNNNNRQKSNFDQKMIMESAQRMNIAKYKTKPCRNYHSSTGCTRGDNCFFIHDPNFKGREIQNFDLRNYERDFPLQMGGFLPQTLIPNLALGNQFPMGGQFGMGLQQMMGMAGNIGINNMGTNNIVLNMYSERLFVGGFDVCPEK